MPFRDSEYRRKYRRKWYSQNKESEKQHVYKRKRYLKNWFLDFKKNLNCSKCNENHPATLEFHHKKEHKKEKAIGDMVDDGYSIKKILEEIKKCEVLCSNCHKKLHYNNKNLKTLSNYSK